MFQHRSVELSWSDGGCYENLLKLYTCHIYIYYLYNYIYNTYVCVCVSYSYHIIISSYHHISSYTPVYTPKRKRRHWHLFGCLVRSISTVGGFSLPSDPQKCIKTRLIKSRLNHSKEFFDISHGCGVGATPIPQWNTQLIKLRDQREITGTLWMTQYDSTAAKVQHKFDHPPECNINSSILQLQYGQSYHPMWRYLPGPCATKSTEESLGWGQRFLISYHINDAMQRIAIMAIRCHRQILVHLGAAQPLKGHWFALTLQIFVDHLQHLPENHHVYFHAWQNARYLTGKARNQSNTIKFTKAY